MRIPNACIVMVRMTQPDPYPQENHALGKIPPHY